MLNAAWRSNVAQGVGTTGETEQQDAEQDEGEPLSGLFPNASENQEKRNQEQWQGEHDMHRRLKGREVHDRSEHQFQPIDIENGMGVHRAEPLDRDCDNAKTEGQADPNNARRRRFLTARNNQRRERRADEGKFEKAENNEQELFRGRAGISAASGGAGQNIEFRQQRAGVLFADTAGPREGRRKHVELRFARLAVYCPAEFDDLGRTVAQKTVEIEIGRSGKNLADRFSGLARFRPDFLEGCPFFREIIEDCVS